MIKTIGISLLMVLLISGGGIWFYHKQCGTRMAWVNFNKVYDEFLYKKELEQKFNQAQQARKKMVDSLELDLKMLYGQIKDKGGNTEKEELFELKRRQFLEQKNRLDEDGANNQRSFQEQILNQLNQYVKDFGEENEYTVILGADGSGSVMYAKQGIEITTDVINFINKKYKGK